MKEGRETVLENLQVNNLWLKRGSHQIFSNFSIVFEAEKVPVPVGMSGRGEAKGRSNHGSSWDWLLLPHRAKTGVQPNRSIEKSLHKRAV